MATWDDVLELGLALPEVQQSLSYGTPALKVRNKLMARQRESPTILVVRVDLAERPALLAAEPDRFYIVAHYDVHPWILVRLPKIGRRELREMLTDAWLLRASKALLEEHAERLTGELRH